MARLLLFSLLAACGGVSPSGSPAPGQRLLSELDDEALCALDAQHNERWERELSTDLQCFLHSNAQGQVAVAVDADADYVAVCEQARLACEAGEVELDPYDVELGVCDADGARPDDACPATVADFEACSAAILDGFAALAALGCQPGVLDELDRTYGELASLEVCVLLGC